MVKGIYNFWKVRELTDKFNESRRQISSGVGKTADESMSSIRFCSTPKADLPYYSYIFRDMDPLGTEVKNVAIPRVGAPRVD